MEDNFIKLPRVLEILCMSKTCFYNHRLVLKIPTYKISPKGKLVRYKEQEVRDAFNKFRRDSGEEPEE